jgi:hypothetical protein
MKDFITEITNDNDDLEELIMYMLPIPTIYYWHLRDICWISRRLTDMMLPILEKMPLILDFIDEGFVLYGIAVLHVIHQVIHGHSHQGSIPLLWVKLYNPDETKNSSAIAIANESKYTPYRCCHVTPPLISMNAQPEKNDIIVEASRCVFYVLQNEKDKDLMSVLSLCLIRDGKHYKLMNLEGAIDDIINRRIRPYLVSLSVLNASLHLFGYGYSVTTDFVQVYMEFQNQRNNPTQEMMNNIFRDLSILEVYPDRINHIISSLINDHRIVMKLLQFDKSLIYSIDGLSTTYKYRESRYIAVILSLHGFIVMEDGIIPPCKHMKTSLSENLIMGYLCS